MFCLCVVSHIGLPFVCLITVGCSYIQTSDIEIWLVCESKCLNCMRTDKDEDDQSSGQELLQVQHVSWSLDVH